MTAQCVLLLHKAPDEALEMSRCTLEATLWALLTRSQFCIGKEMQEWPRYSLIYLPGHCNVSKTLWTSLSAAITAARIVQWRVLSAVGHWTRLLCQVWYQKLSFLKSFMLLALKCATGWTSERQKGGFFPVTGF